MVQEKNGFKSTSMDSQLEESILDLNSIMDMVAHKSSFKHHKCTFLKLWFNLKSQYLKL
jgi:hypothetical protein